MEDPKVPFADTTARRAQLMAATERFKSSINNEFESIKGDASEIGKTAALVAGVGLAVYLIANAILPKSDEYRYAERYGELDDQDYDYANADEDSYRDRVMASRRAGEQGNNKPASGAISGLISGMVTSVLTGIAREQLAGILARIRNNNAINPTAAPTPREEQYHEKAPTQPVNYSTQL